MNILITKNTNDNLTSQDELVDAIANIPNEKFEEFINSVINIAVKHNKTFEDKDTLKCGIQVEPKKIKNCLLHVYCVGAIYSFEVSMIANKVKFTLHACLAGNEISRVVESKEMEDLFNDFLRDNIENYDNLLKQEIEKVEGKLKADKLEK